MRKKFCLAFAAFCGAICFFTFYNSQERLVLKPLSQTLTVYTQSNSSSARIEKFAVTNAFAILPSNIKGESCCLTGVTADSLFKFYAAQIVFTETVGSIVNYYAYSQRIKYRVDINGKTVNLHIAIKNDKITDGNITVGTPLIFGSY